MSRLLHHKQDRYDEPLVELVLCSARGDFTFQLPIQPKVATVGNSDSAFDFLADVVIGFYAGSQIDEIIYNLKAMTGSRDVVARHKCVDCLFATRIQEIFASLQDKESSCSV